MAFQITNEGKTARNEFRAGPAGTVTASIGPRLIAEVDIGSGSVLSLLDTSIVPSANRAALVQRLIQNESALDAIRRLVFATVFADEESPSAAIWWQLDRTLARLDLDEEFPGTALSQIDAEIDAALETLRDPRVEVSVSRAPLVQALTDLILRRRPQISDLKSTVEVLQSELTRDLVELGDSRGDAIESYRFPNLPKLVILSSGPDLSHALSNKPFEILFRGEIEMTLVVPVADPGIWDGLFQCFLVEPEHENPVAQIAGLGQDRTGQHLGSLVARFRVSPLVDLGSYELVVLPTYHDPTIGTHVVARAIRQAEVLLRTAIRLAQKGKKLEALGRLDDGESAYRTRGVEVPNHFTERIRDIRRRIEDDAYSLDFLGDL
jgi:hypothetical protein